MPLPADNAERVGGNGHVAERLAAVGTEIGRRLEQVRVGSAQPGDDVVVGEDDAERGVGDYQRVEAEADSELEQARG